MLISSRHVLGDENLVKWFLARGADPNSAPPSWPSPLEKAAWCASLPIIQLLVHHGGRIHPSNVFPSAGRSSRPERLEVMAYFLDLGAAIDDVDYAHDIKIFKMHWMRGFGTALHHAARRGDEEMIIFLLEKGAKQDIKNSKGKTALNLAEEEGHDVVASILRAHQSHVQTPM